MIDIQKEAIALGFDAAAAFDPAILEARQDVRDMCNADKCMIFGKNWGCPPHCGTVEECQKKMHSQRISDALEIRYRRSTYSFITQIPKNAL